MNNIELSFDKHPDFFSKISDGVLPKNNRVIMKNLIRSSYKFILRYFNLLPPIDYSLAKLYYIDGLGQRQIKEIFDISQSAVSRRLKYVLNRIHFLLKAPSLDPIQVREDFEKLFPSELFEFAFFYYFELAQNRVKFFVHSSQSGVANKFKDIISYLEDISEEDEKMINNDKDLLNYQTKRWLALTYLDFFRFISKKSNIINFLCKKNDEIRSKALKFDKFILDEVSKDE